MIAKLLNDMDHLQDLISQHHPNGIVIVGDVHGCAITLKSLVEQAKAKWPDALITIAGDLVDRGPRSYDVVQYVMDNKIPCVMGNHEWFFTEATSGNRNARREWMVPRNGGPMTVKSYEAVHDDSIYQDHLTFLSELPIFLRFENVKNTEGRHLLITHTGVDRPWEHFIRSHDNLWTRNRHFEMDGVFNVHGHTPLDNHEVGKTWANIDTGCCFKEEGGKLTALHFPSMEVLQQPNID